MAATTHSSGPAGFGTDLTALAEAGTLARAYAIDARVSNLLAMVTRSPRRSIALLGPAGSGKTALVQELVYELAKPAHGAWRVLRASPSDFMAGTKYLGEWETKVREVVELVRHPRRIVIYVPNLAALSAAGSWSKSESSVASALAPYLEDGSILLLGESTPEEFERGLGRVPALQRLFERVLINEASTEESLAILTSLRDARGLRMTDDVASRLLDASGQFLGHVSRPGSAIALLRAVEDAAAGSGRPITYRHVLDALSKSTGIPAELLDDSTSLDATAVRRFFTNRIMGQSDAVDAVVDLVTLIKAGLTDPQKPFGVFMFVGRRQDRAGEGAGGVHLWRRLPPRAF
jgi:ATP-dependent Clp protease ATP-binding subunit ClpC